MRQGDSRLADQPRELNVINQSELEAAMAPIPELADQIQALAPELDALFDIIADEGPVLPFIAAPTSTATPGRRTGSASC